MWNKAQVALSHPKDVYDVLMCPNDSDNNWGSFLTQVPTAIAVPIEFLDHSALTSLISYLGPL